MFMVTGESSTRMRYSNFSRSTLWSIENWLPLRPAMPRGFCFFPAILVSNSTRSKDWSFSLPVTAIKKRRGSLLGVTVTFSPGARIVTSTSVTAAIFAPGKRARPMARWNFPPKLGLYSKIKVKATKPAVAISHLRNRAKGRVLVMSSVLTREETSFCTSLRKISESLSTPSSLASSTAERRSSLSSGAVCSIKRASFLRLGNSNRSLAQVRQTARMTTAYPR